jgi:hypothetical protein
MKNSDASKGKEVLAHGSFSNKPPVNGNHITLAEVSGRFNIILFAAPASDKLKQVIGLRNNHKIVSPI